MRRSAVAVAVAVAACAGPSRPAPPAPAPPVDDAPPAVVAPPVAIVDDAAPGPGEAWLRGSTHVHALPSGDSRTPVADVIAWYATRDYDFIALTDHNRITDTYGPTPGDVAVHDGDDLVVLSGVELTNNPDNCDPPPPEPDGRCRIHVNLIGVTARPGEKLAWAAHDAPARLDKYQAAIDQRAVLGGIVQLNHPQWHWGMTAGLLTELGARGVALVEIANAQFPTWNAGTDRYPSTEDLWDAALTAGVTIWGVASDDAHDFRQDGGGRYPAGGAWVVVRARREPAAIVEALAAGRFYGSTGVTLARAGRVGQELVVEVARGGDGGGDGDGGGGGDGDGGGDDHLAHTIRFIGDGRVLGELPGPVARWPLDGTTSYVRAVVIREDGARAWVQPVR